MKGLPTVDRDLFGLSSSLLISSRMDSGLHTTPGHSSFKSYASQELSHHSSHPLGPHTYPSWAPMFCSVPQEMWRRHTLSASVLPGPLRAVAPLSAASAFTASLASQGPSSRPSFWPPVAYLQCPNVYIFVYLKGSSNSTCLKSNLWQFLLLPVFPVQRMLSPFIQIFTSEISVF